METKSTLSSSDFIFSPSIFSAEAVARGHPDKLADQIADAIVDECLRQDPLSRIAVEVMVSHSSIAIAGEVTSKAVFDPKAIAVETATSIGYDNPRFGNWIASIQDISIDIAKQSEDIAQSLHPSDMPYPYTACGDQGISIGYASQETQERIPLEQLLARQLVETIEERKKSCARYNDLLGPDGKALVAIDHARHPVQSPLVIVSWQHYEKCCGHDIRPLIDDAVQEVFSHHRIGIHQLLINPSGRFVRGGPYADTGLTGRKQLIDCYGTRVPIGGGSFSGKDATKVDRSGAYFARWLANHVIASKLALECQVSLTFSMGRQKPALICLDCKGSEAIPIAHIAQWLQCTFPWTIHDIMREFSLQTPIFSMTSYGGHFGRKELPWENISHTYPGNGI